MFTLPDLILVMLCSILANLSSPCQSHLDTALRVVWYLKGTTTHGFFYPVVVNLSLSAYCDTDWATFKFTYHSLIGYYIFLGSALILWKTKK